MNAVLNYRQSAGGGQFFWITVYMVYW